MVPSCPEVPGKRGEGESSYQLDPSPVRSRHPREAALRRIPTRGKQMQVPRDDLEGSTGDEIERGVQEEDSASGTPSYSPCHTYSPT